MECGKDLIQLAVCRFSQEQLPAPAGLAPAERRIDHYGPAFKRCSPFFSSFPPPGPRRAPSTRDRRRKRGKKRRKGAGKAAFLVANPPLRWGKPSGGGINRQTASRMRSWMPSLELALPNSLPLYFRPLLFQSLCRDGHRRSQLLGEKRDAILLQHPAILDQLGIGFALRPVLPRSNRDRPAIGAGILQTAHGPSPSRRRPGRRGGRGWRGSSAGNAAARSMASCSGTSARPAAKAGRGRRRWRIAISRLPPAARWAVRACPRQANRPHPLPPSGHRPKVGRERETVMPSPPAPLPSTGEGRLVTASSAVRASR